MRHYYQTQETFLNKRLILLTNGFICPFTGKNRSIIFQRFYLRVLTQHNVRSFRRVVTSALSQECATTPFLKVIFIIFPDLINTKITAQKLKDTRRRVAGLEPTLPRYTRDTHTVDIQDPFPGLGCRAGRSFQSCQEQQKKWPGPQPWPGPA